MTPREKEYYQQIRRRFEDEQKIARAVKWAIYVMLAGLLVCWVWNL
ncbi:hypothetical protein [Pedobacter ginsengisoli]|nr:hypothetical protein [Pedobacter ginsengisoli]